jgi:hypothetical protein
MNQILWQGRGGLARAGACATEHKRPIDTILDGPYDALCCATLGHGTLCPVRVVTPDCPLAVAMALASRQQHKTLLTRTLSCFL